MKKIILISGKAQHGKDTFGEMLKNILVEKNNQVQIIHFGDLVKFVSKQYYNWNGEKDKIGRSILQMVGTEIVREKDEHFWTDFVARLINTMTADYIIIPDWRFEEEHVRLLDFFEFLDIITIRIQRVEKTEGQKYKPYVNPMMLPSQLKHRSEVELDDYVFNYIVYNVTLEELKQSAELFIEDMENN